MKHWHGWLVSSFLLRIRFCQVALALTYKFISPVCFDTEYTMHYYYFMYCSVVEQIRLKSHLYCSQLSYIFCSGLWKLTVCYEDLVWFLQLWLSDPRLLLVVHQTCICHVFSSSPLSLRLSMTFQSFFPSSGFISANTLTSSKYHTTPVSPHTV